MSCPVTVRLGVHALGVSDAAERLLMESHLADCPACSAELSYLEPLPGLLARVPADLLSDDPQPSGRAARARKARAPAVRWRAAGLVAAVAFAVAAAIWLGQPAATRPAANSPAAAVTLSGADPVTHVRVTVTLTRTSWGTSIRMRAWGLPLNEPCRLIVRSAAGGTEVAGAWDAWHAGPVRIPASSAWRPADISSLRVATTGRTLVIVRSRPPG
jgi:hypothetical protein